MEGPPSAELDINSLETPQSVLPDSTSRQREVAKKLAEAAAAFERNWVMGVLGRGALKEVFWGR